VILGGCSLQWQGQHSPTSNYIEGPVATDNRMMAERAMSRSITRKPSCLISIMSRKISTCTQQDYRQILDELEDFWDGGEEG